VSKRRENFGELEPNVKSKNSCFRNELLHVQD